jgi:hypothetical protein
VDWSQEVLCSRPHHRHALTQICLCAQRVLRSISTCLCSDALSPVYTCATKDGSLKVWAAMVQTSALPTILPLLVELVVQDWPEGHPLSLLTGSASWSSVLRTLL